MEIPTTATTAVKTAFNWKLIVTILILVIVVSWILSKIAKQTVVIKDENGNVIGNGEIVRKMNALLIPSALKAKA